MSLIAMLVSTIGAITAQVILNTWLKNDVISQNFGSALLDFLASKTDDYLAARDGERFFSNIGDRISSHLVPLFEQYQDRPQELREKSLSVESVALEVSNAIKDAQLSHKIFISCNYDAHRIFDQIKENHYSNPLFSEAENNLYEQALMLSIQYILEILRTLPDFNQNNFAEILERIDTSTDKVLEAIKKVNDLRVLTEKQAQKIDADFELEYRLGIAKKLDNVNLFGADFKTREAKKYKLSVAYISLDMSENLNQETKRRSDWVPTRIPVQEAIRKSKRTVIIGDAGSGKTTLLQWIAVNAAEDRFRKNLINWKDKVPFFIELRRFTNELPAPENFVKETLPIIAGNMPSKWVHKLLRDGRAIILIDGLDEVIPEHRKKVEEWIDELLNTYSDIHIVVSSRPASYKAGQLKRHQFNEFVLMPMDMDEIILFVNYWHKAVLLEANIETQEQVDIILNRLLAEIKDRPHLSKLATNPLLCAMICALHYEHFMQLPSDRLALYEACCSMLIERRDAERYIQLTNYPKLSYPQKRVFLDVLAYWMIKNGYSTFTYKQAIEKIVDCIPNTLTQDIKPEDIFSLLFERSGMLRETFEKHYDFIHRTFQEYMAACRVASERDWGLLLDNANKDQWKETIIIAAGKANQSEADELLQGLLTLSDKKYNSKGSYLNLLAISCLENIVQASPSIRKKVQSRLSLLIPPQDSSQSASLISAGELAIPYLGPKDDYSEDDRAACIEVLGKIGTIDALKEMGKYLPDKRTKIIKALDLSLALIKSHDVHRSGLARILLASLKQFIKKDTISLRASFINALFEERIDAWRKNIGNVKHLRILDCNEASLYILNVFPEIFSLTLAGNWLPSDLKNICTLNKLNLLDLRCFTSWPDFSSTVPLSNIQNLKLWSAPPILPIINAQLFPNLKKIEIFCNNIDPEEIDFSDMENLKHVHLASTENYIGSVDFLNVVENLEILELSFSERNFPEYLFGLDNLDVKEIRINVDKKSPYVTKFVEELRIGRLDCQINLTTNWTENSW